MKQPDIPVFFIDESLGNKAVANALIAEGVKVEIHNNHFPEGTRDEEWLKEVGRRNWIVLTKDRRIRYREIEKSSVEKYNVRQFTLTSGNLQAKEMAEIFLKALPKMKKFILNNKSPFIAKVTNSGIVKMITNFK